MINIENLNISELKELLKKIKFYWNLKKQLWIRGVDLFKRELIWKDLLIVEYCWEKESAMKYWTELFKKVFSINADLNDIKFIENKNLKGWIRIFKNDSMIDISFLKIEKLLK